MLLWLGRSFASLVFHSGSRRPRSGHTHFSWDVGEHEATFKMRIIIATFFLLLTTVLAAQENGLTGVYSSVNNKFERWSTMTLNGDSTFIYNYGLGGCQAEIKGTFTVRNSKIEFANDSEITSNEIVNLTESDSLISEIGTPFYPNLSLVDWKVGNNFIKPLGTVDSGCLQESAKHKLN